MSDSIFAVKIDGLEAELEVTPSHIKCVTGNTIHFGVMMSNLRSFIHVTFKQILFNFYKNQQLHKVVITSKHCLSITNVINQITQN